jgi:aminomethyltransferase
MLKQTALTAWHKLNGAKMVAFSGYEMPIWYTSAKNEHLGVRASSGMFDVSHMGMVYFKGSNAASFLQKICTNDIQKTAQNKVIYTMILNEKGGILDDVMVGYNSDLTAYFMIINASNKQKILNWFNLQGVSDVGIEVHFDDFGLVAIQGPKVPLLLKTVINVNWESLMPFQSQLVHMHGHPALVMRTGYTGEDGIEISVSNSVLPQIWSSCIDAGVPPCGLAARDSLRIEFGLPLYGHELTESIHPLQTRYPWVLKWDTQFIGATALSNLNQSPNITTVGLLFNDRCLPRQGDIIKQGGVITSGSFSPVLNRPIAMAMVPSGIGDSLTVNIRSKWVSASVVPLPFVSSKVRH